MFGFHDVSFRLRSHDFTWSVSGRDLGLIVIEESPEPEKKKGKRTLRGQKMQNNIDQDGWVKGEGQDANTSAPRDQETR